MTLWLILGAISASVAAILLYAMRRVSRGVDDTADHDLAVYRAQLEELERDRERGVLEESELESASLEVKRRMLSADAHRSASAMARAAKPGQALPLGLALAVPVAAVLIYMWLGNPGIESQPFAERQAATPPVAEGGTEALPDVDTMMTQLRERLAENPADLQGWFNLGRAAQMLGDYAEAISAYERAIALDGTLATLHSALGEVHFLSSGGIVTEAARRALERALVHDPLDPRARFYLALARNQDGDRNGAFEDLVALLADAPADAAWANGVREQATRIAADLGLHPATVPPPKTLPDDDASPEKAAELAARLADDPKDYQGWIELARLRNALGDPDSAREALARGAEVYAGAPFVQQQLRQAAVELGLEAPEGVARGPSAEDMEAAAQMTPDEQQEMIRGMVAGLAARLEDNPTDAEGWRMLGRSYKVLGEPQKSLEAFARAADLLPEDAAAQLDYAAALLEASDGGAPPPEAIARLEKIVARDPVNADALYYLGEAAHRQGDRAGVTLYWQRLLALLPEDSEEHAWLKGRLDAIAAGN